MTVGVLALFENKKEKKPRTERNPREYYERTALHINVFKYIIVLLLVVFLIGGFTFYSDELSTENMKYMLKFISFGSDGTATNGSVINFDSNESAKALSLRGDLAVVDTNGVQIFDLTGQRLLRDSLYFNDPLIASNGTHLLVCDRDASELYIYSSYAQVSTKKFDYPLQALKASADGNYAVITSSQGFKSSVEVYDGNFRNIFYYNYTSRYANAISLSDTGRLGVCLIANDKDGNFSATVQIFEIAQDTKPIQTFSYTGEVPWSISFLADGGFSLLTNKAMRLYDAEGGIKKEIPFGEQTPKSFCFTARYVVLMEGTSGVTNATQVTFYDQNGNLVTSRSIGNDISGISIIDDNAYLVSVGTLYAIDLTGENGDHTDTVGLDCLAVVDMPEHEQIVIFSRNRAAIYDKVSFNETGLNPSEQ